MRRSKYSEKEIRAFLAEVENGREIDDLCQGLGISERTYGRWRDRYSGVVSMVEYRALEHEVKVLRRRLEERDQDVHNLIEALTGRYDGLDDRMRIANGLMEECQLSERKACRLAALNRTTKWLRSKG